MVEYYNPCHCLMTVCRQSFAQLSYSVHACAYGVFERPLENVKVRGRACGCKCHALSPAILYPTIRLNRWHCNACELNWTDGTGSRAGVLPAQQCQQITMNLSTAAGYDMLTSILQVLLDPITSTGRGMNNNCGNNKSSSSTRANAAAGSSTLPAGGVVVKRRGGSCSSEVRMTKMTLCSRYKLYTILRCVHSWCHHRNGVQWVDCIFIIVVAQDSLLAKTSQMQHRQSDVGVNIMRIQSNTTAAVAHDRRLNEHAAR